MLLLKTKKGVMLLVTNRMIALNTQCELVKAVVANFAKERGEGGKAKKSYKCYNLYSCGHLSHGPEGVALHA